MTFLEELKVGDLVFIEHYGYSIYLGTSIRSELTTYKLYDFFIFKRNKTYPCSEYTINQNNFVIVELS